MEVGDVFTALGCLVPAALLGWAAIWAGKWGDPHSPAPRPPAPAPALPASPIPAINTPWQWRQYEPLGDSFQSLLAAKGAAGQVQQAPGKTEAHREAPARPASFGSDVVVPFCQSIISGLFALGFGLALTAWQEWSWLIGVAFAFMVMLGVWTWRQFDHSRLLWLIEDVTHSDLNGDGNQGKPPPQSYSVHIDYTNKQGGVVLDDLPEPKRGGTTKVCPCHHVGHCNV